MVFEVRKSLGISALTWNAPPSGQDLAPPANLRLQFGGGEAMTTLTPKHIPVRGQRRLSGSSMSKKFHVAGTLTQNDIGSFGNLLLSPRGGGFSANAQDGVIAIRNTDGMDERNANKNE